MEETVLGRMAIVILLIKRLLQFSDTEEFYKYGEIGIAE